MTENSTSAAIRAALNSSGTAHTNAVEMLDAIAQISELQLRHDVFARIDKSMATTTIETVQQMAQRVKEDVLTADAQLWVMFEHVEELEKALPQPEPLPAGMPNADQVRTEDFAAALVKYERAKADMDRFWNEQVKPLSDQYTAAEGEAKVALSDAVDQVEKDFEAFVDAHGDSITAVFTAPSPDLAAHAAKLRVWVETDYQDMEDAAEVMKIIAADAARLSQQGEA